MMISEKLCPAGLSNNPNKPLKSVDYITIHNTDNYKPTATAKNHADYQYNGSGGRQASWHYSVDGNEIWQSFEDTQMCFHAGDGINGVGNTTSIGIEICVNDQLGFKKACDNAAWLVAELIKKHKLTIDKVVQHNRWTGKNCPSELRKGAWGINWNGFIELVKQYSGEQSKIPIIGKSVMTAEQLATYLLSNNPSPKIKCSALELAKYFISEGETEGVRGDVAFYQSLHETGWFKYGGQVLPEQNNFAGIGATNNSPVGKGAWFDTPQIGVRAQIQHLKAYASKESLKNPCVDPRFNLVSRGCAPAWEDLNGRWAVPGTTYAQSFLKLYEAGKNIPVNNSLIGSASTKSAIETAIEALVKSGVISSPDYWLANYGKVQYLEQLIINMSKKLASN